MHKTDQLSITYLKTLHLHKSARFVGLHFLLMIWNSETMIYKQMLSYKIQVLWDRTPWRLVNTVVVDQSKDGGNNLLRYVGNCQYKVRYIPAYRSAPYEMSAAWKERFITVCRMEGWATARFEVGSWKPQGFRETLHKAWALWELA